MSRLTGADAYSLMEAYNNVYAPQELTEEQVWEEVETWVNSLIEEGYDLSDYTWEEMYESYLEEAGMDVFKAIRDANSKPSPVFTQPIKKAPPLGQPGSGFQDRRPVLGMPSNNSLTLPPNRVGPGLVGGKVGPKIVGPKIVGPGKVGPGAAPAAPAAAPTRTTTTTTPPARTATPPGGTTKPTATATPTPAPSASPARPSLSSQADEIRQMRARSLQRQGKTLDAATVSGATRPAYQANSFDVFDVIKGHLIDEGYADTEESALVIMANMSEEWREEILDEANRAETELKLTSRQRERARNLNQYTSRPIFYGTNANRRRKADNSDPILNKAHKEMTAKRQESHKEKRG